MKRKLFFILSCLIFTAVFPCQATKWKAQHVVMIGIDGWGAYSVPKASIPHIKEVMQKGCYTLKKTFRITIFFCGKLGFHVQWSRP